MNITPILDHQWIDVKAIYLEAFPKSERKPFFTVRHSVKKEKRSYLPHQKITPYLGLSWSSLTRISSW